VQERAESAEAEVLERMRLVAEAVADADLLQRRVEALEEEMRETRSKAGGAPAPSAPEARSLDRHPVRQMQTRPLCSAHVVCAPLTPHSPPTTTPGAARIKQLVAKDKALDEELRALRMEGEMNASKLSSMNAALSVVQVMSPPPRTLHPFSHCPRDSRPSEWCAPLTVVYLPFHLT